MVRSLGRFDVYFVCFIMSDLSRSDIPENTASKLEYTAMDTDSSGHDGFIAVSLSHVLSTWRVHSTHAQRYSIACRSRQDKKFLRHADVAQSLRVHPLTTEFTTHGP